jgi:hypothetical protein
MKYLICCILLLITNLAYCGTIDPNASDKDHIEYGKKYTYVLPIAGRLSEESTPFFKASCVVIDEYNILTAAHIVHNSSEQYVIFNDNQYPCALVATHSDFNAGKFGPDDIAIARLEKPIILDTYPDLYTDEDELDKVCGMAGYGFTGTFRTGYKIENFDHKKRGGSNIIEMIQNDMLVFSVNKGQKTQLEFLIAPGDSGGGLFIKQKLAGIHSYIYTTDGKTDSNYNDIACATRISRHIKWINSTRNLLKKTIEDKNAKKRM